MKFPHFTPSQKLEQWIAACSSITQLHYRSLHQFTITNEKNIVSPEEFFKRGGGNAVSYHWFLAYCLWRRFKGKVYIVELAHWFPFKKVLVVVLRRNRTPTYTVFHFDKTHLIYSFKELSTLFTGRRVRFVYRVPDLKKVRI